MFKRIGTILVIINAICLFGTAGTDDLAVMNGAEPSAMMLAVKVGLCILGAVIGGIFVAIGHAREVSR